MPKLRDIAISLLFSLVLLGPAAVYACELMHVELPSWSTAEDARWLAGADKDGDVGESLSLSGFRSGKLQEAVADEIGARIPFKAAAMLGNALLQREFIRVANLPFAYEVHPTYYGSSMYCWPRERMVIGGPPTRTSAFPDSADKFVSACGELARCHPEINWIYYLADRSATTAYSPVIRYRSDACDITYYEEKIRERLPGSCLFLSGRYCSEREFIESSMETDHHWNIRGGVRAYQDICRGLGVDPVTDFEFYEAFEGPCFGSAARTGLCADYVSPMLDVSWDRDAVQVFKNGEELLPESFLDEAYGDGIIALSENEKRFNSYAAWFHPTTGNFTMVNDAVEGGELLIVNDSFGNNMQRLFAEHYHVVHVIDPRYFTGKVDEFLDEHDVDDAVFLTSTVILFEEQALNALVL